MKLTPIAKEGVEGQVTIPETTQMDHPGDVTMPDQSQEKFSRRLPEYPAKVLPSQGRCYPPGYSIIYMPYTHGQLKYYNDSKLEKRERFEFILDGINTSFNKMSEFAFFDFLWVAMHRRFCTFPNCDFYVNFRCGKCGKVHKNQRFSPASIAYDDLLVDMPAEVQLDDGRIMVFNVLMLDKYLYLYENNLIGDDTAMLAAQCTNMEYEEAYAIIDQSIGEEWMAFDEIAKVSYFGVLPLEFKCTGKLEDDQPCDNTIQIIIDDPEVFVYPFRESNGTFRNRINFGNKRTN